MDFTGKTVCITGASKGIGRDIALAFARANANVVLNYNTSKEHADSLADEILAMGKENKVEIIQADVSNPEDVHRMFNIIKEKFKSIDVLVNNAGITRDKMMLFSKEEDWSSVIKTNLDSVFYCSKAAGWLMVNSRKGSIINIASTGGINGTAGQTHYAASKAGVIGFTRALAKELAKYNITVNSIAPGFIDTDMVQTIPEKLREKYIDMIPLKRFGKSEEVADLAVFLASSKSRYITGQTLIIDGGLTS